MAETRLSTEAFLQKAKELFGDTYDLSNVTFGNTDDVIELECKSHGPFTKRVSSFLEGYGCKRCSDETMMRPKEDFVREAKEIHGDAFDYSVIDYKGMRVKITLNCPIHGEFTKTPLEHIQAKAGCPRCKESIGEREVRLWLERNGKKYIPEYSFPDYKYRWDFYVPEQALMIEFHGKQHFVPVERFGGLEGHLGTVKRDKEKLALVKEMGLSQLTISCFDKRTVDEILDEFFAE
ncbi:hypothetical protein [Vibrio phage vB_VmeM-Yong XC31]|nr:hypothetical protein [Vibrio phage vB_VmeM-Yong XC31]